MVYLYCFLGFVLYYFVGIVAMLISDYAMSADKSNYKLKIGTNFFTIGKKESCVGMTIIWPIMVFIMWCVIIIDGTSNAYKNFALFVNERKIWSNFVTKLDNIQIKEAKDGKVD